MKVSEVIVKLEKLKKENGDASVLLVDYYASPVEGISVETIQHSTYEKNEDGSLKENENGSLNLIELNSSEEIVINIYGCGW